MTTAYYNIIDKLREHLINDVLVNTVTHGNIDDVDIKKQNIFPLSHIIVNNAIPSERDITFNISVIQCDVVDISEDSKNNEVDVLNTQLAILNRLAHQLFRGDLWDAKIQLLGSPNCEPFTERFENNLAGWTMTFDVSTPNEMTIC